LLLVQYQSINAGQGVVDAEEERQIEPDKFVNARPPSETNRAARKAEADICRKR